MELCEVTSMVVLLKKIDFQIRAVKKIVAKLGTDMYYALELGFLMFAVGVYSSEKELLEAFKRPVAISDLSKTQAPRPIKNVVILDYEKAVVGLSWSYFGPHDGGSGTCLSC
ncbi:hypothetical protein Pint_07055 [Pistacia integerrima]|uniref:Uncharacterized protein n=1 Tax=Pistacia integerrima TaxID=434235 RepID=A0ACC0XYA4_9ROSI|nr:hypothetical protein Pint_07055 [Pistacia integerrima]